MSRPPVPPFTAETAAAPDGLMRRREASINDVAILSSQRWIFGPRPEGDQTPLPLR